MVSPSFNPRYGRVGMPPLALERLDQSVGLLQQQQQQEAEPSLLPRVKCVLVGDGAIGKTSLIISYTTNGYPTEYIPTAFDNYAVVVTVDSQPIRLQLCDTAGQDDFDSLRPLCYPGTDVFLACFSVVSPTSFHNLSEKWLGELQQHCPKAPIILVGTQCDLRNDVKVLIELAHYQERPVSEEDATSLAERIGAQYIECSALTQKNLKDVFDSAILSAAQHKGLISGYESPKLYNSRDKKSKKLKHTNSKHDNKDRAMWTPPSVKKVPIENRPSKKSSRGWKKFCCMT